MTNEEQRITELIKMVKSGQSQDSLESQLRQLQAVANMVGLYDAADYLCRVLEKK